MIGPLLGTYVFQQAGLSGLSLLCATLFLAIFTVGFGGPLTVKAAAGKGAPTSKDSKKAS
jgi:hypothetical protein